MIVRITKPCFLHKLCRLYEKYNLKTFEIIKKEKNKGYEYIFYTETYETLDGYEMSLSGECLKCIQKVQCAMMPTE